ncbi:MAG: CapA family protein [Patescibacteria group bacterium]
MKKFTIFFGLVLAGVVMYQIQSGKLVFTDAMNLTGAQPVAIKQMAVKTAEKTEDDIEKIEIEDIEEEENADFKILAFGDMMLGRYVRTMADRNGGLDYLFAKFETGPKGLFPQADVVFGNLEGPISGKGKSGGTAMVFSFNEDIAPFLKNSGFDVLSISNNHALDQGSKGRDSTITALEQSELGWCGHPSEADPESIYYGEIGEKKYAFACFQDITHKLDLEDALEMIRRLDAHVDYVIVSVHWGIEYKNSANSAMQVDPGHDFVDAGADFVIGHHPHVVQNFEIYKDKFIFYSLGNFVFDQYWSKATQEELAIGITLKEDGSSEVQLIPMKSANSQSRLMTEEESKEWIERFIGYGDYSEEIQSMIRNKVVIIDPK